MKMFIVTAVLAIVTFGAASVFCGEEVKKPPIEKQATKEIAEEGEENGKPSVWMRMKLRGTEGVLKGLAAGDFDAIQENAKRMNTFSQLERLARGRNEDYQLQLKFFRYANRELVRQASAENLDGATMAFMQLTTSCVNCHRAVRDAEAAVVNAPADFTHVLQRTVDYYVSGPQQARPPEGKFAKGTKVRLIKAAGSYVQVKSEQGVVGFVLADSLAPSAAEKRR